jgi:hypothetical protein
VTSSPPPLEDVTNEQENNIHIARHDPNHLQGLNAMKILTIEYQKYRVEIIIEIEGEIFFLNALLDTISDMNLLNQDLIPSKYWLPSKYSYVGLKNVSTNISFEVSKALIWFDQCSLGMKFLLIDLLVDCVLGTPFLVVFESHGLERTSLGHPTYYLTTPSLISNGPPVKKIISLISKPQINTVFFPTTSLIIIETWDDLNNRPATKNIDDKFRWT